MQKNRGLKLRFLQSEVFVLFTYHASRLTCKVQVEIKRKFTQKEVVIFSPCISSGNTPNSSSTASLENNSGKDEGFFWKGINQENNLITKIFYPVVSGGSRGGPPLIWRKKRGKITEGRNAGRTSKAKPPLPPPPPLAQGLYSPLAWTCIT